MYQKTVFIGSPFLPQCLQNSLKDMKDVGILQVKVLKAVDLLAADFSGIKIFFIFFFIFIYFLPWNDPMAKQNVLHSRSMYREIILFKTESQKKKVQAGSLTLHFSHYPLQIILLWLDNVLVPLAFKDIYEWSVSWLLNWLNVWWRFSRGLQKTDRLPFFSLASLCVLFLAERVV